MSNTTTPQQPKRSVVAIATGFQTAYSCAVMRMSVLELTHIEMKLFSECKYIAAHHADLSTQMPPVPMSPNYVDMLAYYETILCRWILDTEQLFDETHRLNQPWYRDSLETGRVVRLESRGTAAAKAFVLLDVLRAEAKKQTR